MYITGNTTQAEKEIDRYKLDIIGHNEVRWSKNAKTTFRSGKVMLYSSREDELYQKGVGTPRSH